MFLACIYLLIIQKENTQVIQKFVKLISVLDVIVEEYVESVLSAENGARKGKRMGRA